MGKSKRVGKSIKSPRRVAKAKPKTLARKRQATSQGRARARVGPGSARKVESATPRKKTPARSRQAAPVPKRQAPSGTKKAGKPSKRATKPDPTRTRRVVRAAPPKVSQKSSPKRTTTRARERLRQERSERARVAYEVRIERERETFERRSRASLRGHERRRVASDLFVPLARFIRARESGGSPKGIRAAHAAWIREQSKARVKLGARYRAVLEQIGDALGLDEDFIQALDESPPDGES